MGYKLPKILRSSLQEPLGKFFTGKESNTAREVKLYLEKNNPPITISIGDYCSKSLFEENFFPEIVIFDGKTHRTREINLNFDSYEERKTVNPREWILRVAWEVIENSIKQIQSKTSKKCRICIKINGEEDLLVIPAIISLPLGSAVIYGQPHLNTDEGIVVVLVTSSVKKHVKELLNKFDTYEEVSHGDNNN